MFGMGSSMVDICLSAAQYCIAARVQSAFEASQKCYVVIASLPNAAAARKTSRFEGII